MDGTNILDYFGIDPFYIMLGQAVLTIILLIVVIVCIFKIKRLYRSYDYFMRGKDAESLEDFIIGISEEVHRLQNEDRGAKDTIRSINRNLRASYQKFGGPRAISPAPFLCGRIPAHPPASGSWPRYRLLLLFRLSISQKFHA